MIIDRYGVNSSAVRQALEMNEKIKIPFSFEYGFSGNAGDYFIFITLFITLIGLVITLPIFSSDYESGSDDILRSTKNGRRKLAIGRIVASLIIVTTLFLICMTFYIFIVNSAFNWKGLGTSWQIYGAALLFVPFTACSIQVYSAIGGLLIVISVSLFCLFISSKTRTSMKSLLVGIVFWITPFILDRVSGKNIIQWLVYLFPTGGAGITNSMYANLIDINFLKIGSIDIWTPYVIAAVAIVSIIVFPILTIRTYNKYELS